MDVNTLNKVSGYQPAQPAPAVQPAPTGVDAQPAETVQSAPQAQEPTAIEAHRQAEERERSTADVLQRAVRDINTSLSLHHRHMSVHMHEHTGRKVVKVYDSETNEVIREIPPEKVLDAYASMLEMAGLFVDKRG